jgi:ubiquinone/menaquinone biosynthesis C-methylase UbiE
MVKNSIKKINYNFYLKIFPNYNIELEKSVKGCKSLLDVGCGDSSPIKSFSKKLYCVGVDSFKPSIEKSKKLKIHNKYYKVNVLDIGKKFKPNSFDCVLASDLIEHLTKKQGLRLINMMEKIAKKKVIIFTPNGFLSQRIYENNPWQLHKSGWSVEEMKKKGYYVIGINGWKYLRGEYAKIKFWPKILWKIISDITQMFVKKRPTRAFQILCFKNL